MYIAQLLKRDSEEYFFIIKPTDALISQIYFG